MAASIATEELQCNKAKRAVAFEVFRFTQEENVLPEPQEFDAGWKDSAPSSTSTKAAGNVGKVFILVIFYHIVAC